MRRNGFYHATVVPQTAFEDATQQVIIDFKIDPGKRAKFDGLIANGQMERPIESIMKSRIGCGRWLLGWSIPSPRAAHSPVWTDIRSWYPKHDRLLAKVTLVEVGLSSRVPTRSRRC